MIPVSLFVLFFWGKGDDHVKIPSQHLFVGPRGIVSENRIPPRPFGHCWKIGWPQVGAYRGKKYLVLCFVVWNRSRTCPQILQSWQERFDSSAFLEVVRALCTLLHLLAASKPGGRFRSPGSCPNKSLEG